MNLIGVFKTFPKELFRVNNGYQVALRAASPPRQAFDIHINNGFVHAKALDPNPYKAPNGASMRPNSPYQQLLVARLFKGNDIVVYSVPKGTALPHDLVLVHERSDHYSLQPAQQMTLYELNQKITNFLLRSSTTYTREQWLKAYPRATDFWRRSP